MKFVKLIVAIAALAAAGLPRAASAAAPFTNGGPATRVIPANAAPAAPPSTRHVARNGGVHRVNPAASAASGPQDDQQTTVEDGRRTTRNAHPRAAARVGSSPGD